MLLHFVVQKDNHVIRGFLSDWESATVAYIFKQCTRVETTSISYSYDTCRIARPCYYMYNGIYLAIHCKKGFVISTIVFLTRIATVDTVL